MTTFFLTTFWTPTFHTFLEIFMDLDPKRVPKWSRILRRNGTHFRQIPPKWPKWAPRGAKASKKTPKWSPRVPKWSPKASQIEVLGLKTVVKKGREFRPFRRSTTHTTQHNESTHLALNTLGWKQLRQTAQHPQSSKMSRSPMNQ